MSAIPHELLLRSLSGTTCPSCAVTAPMKRLLPRRLRCPREGRVDGAGASFPPPPMSFFTERDLGDGNEAGPTGRLDQIPPLLVHGMILSPFLDSGICASGFFVREPGTHAFDEFLDSLAGDFRLSRLGKKCPEVGKVPIGVQALAARIGPGQVGASAGIPLLCRRTEPAQSLLH